MGCDRQSHGLNGFKASVPILAAAKTDSTGVGAPVRLKRAIASSPFAVQVFSLSRRVVRFDRILGLTRISLGVHPTIQLS